MTTNAQTSDTYAEGKALAAQIIEHDGDRFTLGPCRLEVNSSASGTTFTPYTRRFKGVTARPLGEPTGQVGAILRMMDVTAERHEGFRRALHVYAGRRARAMAGELDLKPDERAAIISRVQETFGHHIEYANPMAAVRAVCLAWDKAVRERDENLAAIAAAAATTRQQEDAILRYAREELPDLPEDISPVEAVRQLAEALAGERGRAERLLVTAETNRKKRDAPLFTHLDATADQAESFIAGIAHVFGWDSDARFVDLDALLADVKGARVAQRTLREHVSAEAAHDHSMEFQVTRLQSIILAQHLVARGESQSPKLRLLLSWLSGQVAPPDEYTSETLERLLHLLSLRDEASEARARRALADLEVEAAQAVTGSPRPSTEQAAK